MQLFRASLPGDLRKAVTQHDQKTITLDDMYQVATDTQIESGPKASRPVAAVNEDSQLEAEEEEEAENEVAAFQNKWNNHFQNRTIYQNQGPPQCNNRYSARSGNNQNRNGKYCF
jgi:hypothetical protein